MRITELLVENQQQLDEGPLGSLGKAAGKAVGGVAKGIGAVAGGIAGIPGAVKKGFQAGKKTVAGDDAAKPAAGAAPAAGAEPAQQPASGGGGGIVQQFKKGFAQGRGATAADQKTEPAAQQTAAPAAGAQEPAAAPAAAAEPAQQQPAAATAAPAPATQQPADGQQPAAAPAAKAGTPYKAAQDAVAKLDKRGKQNLLKLLQKEFPQAAPAQKPAAAPAAGAQQPAAEPAAKPAASKGPSGGEYDNLGFGFDGNTGKPFKSQAEREAGLAREKAAAAKAAAQPAAEPAAKPATAPAAEPADSDAGKPGFLQSKIKGRRSPAKPSQAEIDADRERIMGVTSDSKINKGNPLAEALAKRVEEHKRKMFEDSLRKGQFSIFVK